MLNAALALRPDFALAKHLLGWALLAAMRLVEGVEGVDAAVDRKAPLDVAEYDRWCGLMSVAAILGMSLAQILARVPYFALPRRRVDSWSRRRRGIRRRACSRRRRKAIGTK